MEKKNSLGKYYLVSNQPIFKDLSESDKAYIANNAQLTEYSKGEVIYRTGDNDRYFYIIVFGAVHTYIPKEENQSVAILRKGDCFGLVSLLTRQPHSLTAKALSDVRTLRIEEKHFYALLERIPSLSLKLNNLLSKRLRVIRDGTQNVYESDILAFFSLLDNQVQTHYLDKLCKFIYEASKKKAIVLSINKENYGLENIRCLKLQSQTELTQEIDRIIFDYHYILLDLPFGYTSVTDLGVHQSDWLYSIDDKTDKTEQLQKIIVEIQEKHKMANNLVKTLCIKPDLSTESVDKILRRSARAISEVSIGIALGGGAALGLAQVGVIKVLERNHVPIDMIAGTSIGAMIGCLWASGLNANEIGEITSSFDSFFKVLSLVDLTFPKKGIIAGKNIREFLLEKTKSYTFEDLPVPFRAITCDISKREEVVLGTGIVADAVMASIAIPGVFTPIHTKEGQVYVDGGVVNPMPVSVLSAEGFKRIIAVNSMPSSKVSLKSNNQSQSLVDIVLNSLYSLQYRIAKYSSQQADVYLNPILENSSWYEFHRAKEFIELGEKEAEEALPDILALLKQPNLDS
jgi:predicted acylesterase/phospholipase RssA/CRP-like cAMP-binding protein